MTLTLHQHPFASYCWKALIALYELDLPFERRLVEGEADRAALAELWPTGGIPVLVDHDSALVLPESTVIVEYLDGLAGRGRLIPADALPARLWDRVFDSHVMTPMQKIVGDALRPADAKDPHGVEEARSTLERAYRLVDARLIEAPWAGGDTFTLADCAGAASLFYANVVHPWDATELPHLDRYHEALLARPSVARVVDEARPYRPLFPLPWPATAP